MEAKCRQSLLFIRLVEGIHLYVAQLYHNIGIVLNEVRSSEGKLATIERASGNATESNNE